MAQNIYDRPDFFAGYSQLRRSIDGLDGATEWPSVRSLLPDVAGLRIVDLGCGFGWFCRWAKEQGAAEVLGLDMSEKMLSRARSWPDAGIRYEVSDLERLELPHSPIRPRLQLLGSALCRESRATVRHGSRRPGPGRLFRLLDRAPYLHGAVAPRLVGRCGGSENMACRRLPDRGAAHDGLARQRRRKASSDPRHDIEPPHPFRLPSRARRGVLSERRTNRYAAGIGRRARPPHVPSRSWTTINDAQKRLSPAAPPSRGVRMRIHPRCGRTPDCKGRATRERGSRMLSTEACFAVAYGIITNIICEISQSRGQPANGNRSAFERSLDD